MKELINAATVNRVTDKATGKFLGYGVKSDSSEQYYCVNWNDARNEYSCNCKAIKPCKHIRAVVEVVKARTELKAVNGELPGACGKVVSNREQAIAGVVTRNPQAFVKPEQVKSATYEQGAARLARAQAKTTPAKSTVAPLNGNRPFSLMR